MATALGGRGSPLRCVWKIVRRGKGIPARPSPSTIGVADVFPGSTSLFVLADRLVRLVFIEEAPLWTLDLPSVPRPYGTRTPRHPFRLANPYDQGANSLRTSVAVERFL